MRSLPRPTLPVIVAVAAVAVGLVAITVTINNPEAPPRAMPAVSYYHDTPARHNYEAALLAAPNRTDSGLGAYIDEAAGGRVLVTQLQNEPCQPSCLTAVRQGDGYAVTLPVSYTYASGSQGFNGPFGKVVRLIYWDPQAHAAKTVTSSDGLAVKLPAVLYERTIGSVKINETAYTSPNYVRTDEHGQTVVWPNVQVWYEPGGHYYGLADMARITRTADGFDVCLPASYGQLLDGSRMSGGSLPARILEHC